EPRVVGDVEHHLVGPVEFGLVEALLAVRPAREAFCPELLELVDHLVDVLDQHAEVMNAAEVEPRALVPAEPQDRHVERAVAQKNTVGLARLARLEPAHLLELERLLVELGGGERILRRDRDVPKLCHAVLLQSSLNPYTVRAASRDTYPLRTSSRTLSRPRFRGSPNPPPPPVSMRTRSPGLSCTASLSAWRVVPSAAWIVTLPGGASCPPCMPQAGHLVRSNRVDMRAGASIR